MSYPKSMIYVMSGVPIDNTYEHSLFFRNAGEQFQYFQTKVVQTFTNYTYLREGHSIKVTGNIKDADTWTYLYYTNGDGQGFYNFITRAVYINDATVQLDLELDVIQTFMFKWNMQQCFIERTHTRTDRIGEHTIPEGLETGPLVDNYVKYINLEDLCIMVLTAVDGNCQSAWSKVYDGVFSGLAIYAVDVSQSERFGEWLDDLSSGGIIDAIVSMWMYPKSLVSIVGDWSDTVTFLKKVNGCKLGVTKTITDPINAMDKPSINGYVPDNNKLFTYPYTMMYVSNNLGGSAVYRRELFGTNGQSASYDFTLMGGVAPDSGVRLVPKGYCNGTTSNNFDEGISIGSFPTCAWDSDTYKVWLAQNQHTQALTMTQAKIQAGVGVVSGIGALATGNVLGAAGALGVSYNALSTTQTLMAQKADMEIQPPQARGNQSANLNLANGRQGFDIHFKTISAEYAMCIDQYFTRYGYKVNRIMTPNLKARERFTYIKTVGCLVTGNFSNENQLKIQSIFDKGITFWVNPDHVGNYTTGNKTL